MDKNQDLENFRQRPENTKNAPQIGEWDPSIKDNLYRSTNRKTGRSRSPVFYNFLRRGEGPFLSI